MTSPKLLIGLMVFFVLAQVICNWMENQPMIQGASPNILVGSDGKMIPVNIQAPVTITDKVLNFVGNLFLFNYPVFKNVNSITGVATDNEFVLFRYILICFGLVMWIDVLLTARRLIFGG